MAGPVIEVNQDNYQAEVLDDPLPVVIDFWAPWCGPCRAVGPVLEDLAGQYTGKVKVVKINVDNNQAIAANFQIQGIPTLVVMKGGEQIDKKVGFGGRPALEQMFAQLAG